MAEQPANQPTRQPAKQLAKQSASQRLYRGQDVCLGGVCSGIANRFDLDTIVVRIMAIALTIITLGLAALVYVVMWAILDQEPSHAAPCEVKPEQAESSAYGFIDLEDSGLNAQRRGDGGTGFSLSVRVAVAVCLAVLFLLVAVSVSPMVSGSKWWQFWPVGLVILGLCLIIMPAGDQLQGSHWHAIGIALAAIAISCVPMSLGIVSWYTFSRALIGMWPLALLAFALYGVGVYRKNGALMIMSSLIVAVFCLAMLMNFAIPGDVAHLLINIPNGRSINIVITQAFWPAW